MASNKNILHNWDFRNPINQRNIINGQLIGDGYSIDRWRAYHIIFTTLDSTGITIQNSSGTAVFYQILENGFNKFNGKTLTFSMLIDGTYYTCTGTCNLTQGSVCTVAQALITGGNEFIDIMFDGTNLMCRYATELTTARKFVCSKLELGSDSTLANDPSADFGEQLAICQRFYELFAIRYSAAGLTSGMGYTLPMSYVVSKRVAPTINLFEDGSVGVEDVVIETVGMDGSGFNNGNYNNFHFTFTATATSVGIHKHATFSADL